LEEPAALVFRVANFRFHNPRFRSWDLPLLSVITRMLNSVFEKFDQLVFLPPPPPLFAKKWSCTTDKPLSQNTVTTRQSAVVSLVWC